MPDILYPSLYQINTRVLLTARRRALGRAVTLDDVPDALLDQAAERGFDLVWFLGVWQTGPAGRAVSRSKAEWRADFLKALPDLSEDDICGSPFAIQAYTVHADFGGDAALARLRERLRRLGLRLMLDFVPNHSALDHPWTRSHPEFYIRGSEAELAHAPQNYTRIETAQGPGVLAYGRDPYFPGWPDTLQLNYRHPKLRAAMIEVLRAIATRCDGVRCDMAMLVLPEVFARTWGQASIPWDGAAPVDTPFWTEAIGRVRQESPEFLFMAEAYWDLEWELQQQGFDYTYDKRLYDRLHSGDAGAVRGHLHADPEFQRRSVRFLENHDEPRAAFVFPLEAHRAAAVVTFLVPGLRFFHHGQIEGKRRHISMHVARGPAEEVDTRVEGFYLRLLECLKRPVVRQGEWSLRECRQAWEGNGTWGQFIVFTWQGTGRTLLVCVNYGSAQGQCYVDLPLREWAGKKVSLRDLLSEARYEREDLPRNALYLDMPPWGYHVFEVVEA
jgi:hypothetical protein